MSSSATLLTNNLNGANPSTLHRLHHHHHAPHKHAKLASTASNASHDSTTSSTPDGSSSSAAIYVDEQEEPHHHHQHQHTSYAYHLHHSKSAETNTHKPSVNLTTTNTENIALELSQHTNPPPPPPQQRERARSASYSTVSSSSYLHSHHQHHHHPRSSSSSFSANVGEEHVQTSYSQSSSSNQHKPTHSFINNCSTNNTKNSIFSDDYSTYLANYKLFANLCSPQEYYAQIQLGQLPFINSKKTKDRRSDCPSDISSIDSRRRKKNKLSKMRQLLAWMKYVNSVICSIIKLSFDFLILACNKVQKWQKELQEAPIEVKEKYFFVISTLISTILFYILFLCLDFMIKHWFALPTLITEYSFPISYCISYLTSVIWQHFFNQYFVFALKASADFDTMNGINMSMANGNDNFCPSLIRTYIVYGFSLFMTGILGSLLQSYTGIADEFIFFLTLPTSGCMNYYLLRYCHSKHNGDYQYRAVPSNDNEKYYHSKTRHHHHGHHSASAHHKGKYSRSSSNILYNNHHPGTLNKHHHHHHHHKKLVATKPHKSNKGHHSKPNQAMDDIVIV